jgi:hypothetical protein
MDLEEVGQGVIGWIGLGQDRGKWTAFVNAVMNLWAEYNTGSFSSGYTTDGLSSSAQLYRVSQLVITCFLGSVNRPES